MKTIIICIVAALAAFTASAAVYQLTNNAASVDINVAGNWSGGVVPGAGDDVEIINPNPQTLTFSGGTTLTWNSLRLFGTNNVLRTFDIGEGRSLTILNGVRLANEAGATNRMAWNTGQLFVTNDAKSSTLTIGYYTPGAATPVGSGAVGWGTFQRWTVVVDRVDVRTNPPPNVSPLNLQSASVLGLFEVRNGGTNFSGNETFDAMFKLSGGFWRLHNGYDNAYTEMLFGLGGIHLDGPATYLRNDRANGNFRSSSAPNSLMIITNGATLESARTAAGGTWAVGDANAKNARMFVVNNGVLTTRMNSVTLGVVGNGQKSGTNSIYIGSGGKIYSTHGYVGRVTGNNIANAVSFNNVATVTGPGSEWRCRDSFFVALNDCTGTSSGNRIDTNTLIVADGGLIMATGVFSIGALGPVAVGTFSENKVLLDGGTIIVTSRYNTGTFEVRNGRFIMSGGTLLCDRFLAVNAPNGMVELSGGTLHAKQDATIGGGIALTNYGAMTIGGTLTMQAGSMLAGTGAVNGAVAFANGATLSPGLSPGSMAISANLAMNEGSIYLWEKGPGFYNADQVLVGGNLNIAGVTTIQVVNAGATPGGPAETNTAFAVSGTLTGFGNLVLDMSGTPGWLGELIQDGDDVNVLLIPEPVAVLAIAGLCGLLAARRRCE